METSRQAVAATESIALLDMRHAAATMAAQVSATGGAETTVNGEDNTPLWSRRGSPSLLFR